MADFTVELDRIDFVGAGLTRPECVLATADGSLYCSDWSGAGGVMKIAADGSQTLYQARPDDGFQVRPNGIALLGDGSFLLAHLGDTGGVFRLDRDGTLAPYLLEVDGTALPPTNFVAADRQGRVWVTVSTRLEPRARAYRADVADGFIVLADGDGARIVADGIGYTNECQVHPSGAWLYCNETFARRLSRFPLSEDGSLGRRETVTEFGGGVFPDGMVFDEEGAVWVTAVVANQVIRVAPDGSQQIVVSDSDPDHVAAAEAAFQAGEMGRPHLDNIASVKLRNISSLAFGGPDRRTCYLGCLLGDRIARFDSPVRGAEPAHWGVV
ncbi:MAG: SMP-30/gluconolactonase/LRE family protein [Minwuiales bacterium]|nr:SMP-30/gluconolactonase/LRE family protein [Minwuiales bacterium]